MRDAEKNVSKIRERIKNAEGVLLLLDFDGTISPFVPRPERAYLPASTRFTLKRISRRWPVGIVTGRSLDVIRPKISIRGIIYGASHGLEWDFGSGRKQNQISGDIMNVFAEVRQGLLKLHSKYPRLIEEKRRFAVTFHYHLVPVREWHAVKKDIDNLLAPLRKKRVLRIMRERETIDIVPRFHGTKGEIALSILRHLQETSGERLLPIYIGDGISDEDAFKALRNGITVRVGKGNTSAAEFYLENQKRVGIFLQWLLKQAESAPSRTIAF